MTFIPGSPLSPASWRWALATWLVKTGRAIPDRFRDSWVDRAQRYLADRRGCLHDPVVRQAVELHLGESLLRRAHLHAYLLTGVPLSVVAGRCDVSVLVVEAYRMLFFDVRLTARDKVAVLIGPGL